MKTTFYAENTEVQLSTTFGTQLAKIHEVCEHKYKKKGINCPEFIHLTIFPQSALGAFQEALVIKNLPANAGGSRGVGSIPGSGRGLKRKQRPAPKFLSRKCCGQRSSAGYTAHGSAKSQTHLSTQHLSWGFPDGLMVKNPPANAGDTGSIPGSGRSPGEGNGNPL